MIIDLSGKGSSGGKVDLSSIIPEGDENTIYIRDNIVLYNDKMWVCSVDEATEGVFIEDEWDEIENYTTEWLNARLAERIKYDDLETTVTKTSTNPVMSSGIYSAINPDNMVDTTTSAVSVALDSGKTYKYMLSTGIATLTFTLNVPADENITNLWRIKFKSGATATEFTPPSGLLWPNGEQLVPEANTVYEIMIDEDLCVTYIGYKEATE